MVRMWLRLLKMLSILIMKTGTDRVIRDMHPDMCFGYISEPVEGLKVAEQMGDFFGITGYERTVGMLSRIFNVLETGKMGERLDIYGPVPV